MNASPATPSTRDGRPAIVMDGLTKAYPDGTLALDPIDLTIERGAFVSLLGPSGCGKSTLLRLVAGMTTPTGGQITGPFAPGSAAPGRTGFVFQDATLMPWASVAENVALPLRLLSGTQGERRDRVMEALELVGLQAFADRLPRQLSGGMRMRVSLARAIVTRPDLILLDEPFGALDEITRFDLNEELLRLWRDQGMTALFVTHSVSEAVFLSQNVLVMSPRPGRIRDRFAIDLPERREAALRTDPDFARLTARVSESLRQGMDPRGADPTGGRASP